MAEEYFLYSSVEASPEEAIDFLVTALDAQRTEIGLLRGETLTMSVLAADSDDVERGLGLGITGTRLSGLIRIRSLDLAQADDDLHAAIRAVLGLLDHYPGDAVLTFDSWIVLRRVGTSLQLNSDWPGWEEVPALQPIVEAYEMRALPKRA